MSFLIPREDSRIVASRRTLEDGNRPTLGTLYQSLDQNDGDADKNLRRSPSSSVINFYPRWCNCHCFSHKKYGRKEKVPFCRRCQNAFSCPPQGVLSRFLLFFFISGTFWFVCWALDKHMALDTISAIIILEITGLVFGILIKMIRLPSLLAPLILGIIYKNIPNVYFFNGLHNRGWIEPIREMALTIILTRAGLELSPKQMKKLKGIVPLAAFGPCLVEACACAGFFYALFHDQGIDWKMCFVAGFALAAVSPAVVVPGMLSLKRRKYGEHEGVATLMIAASSIDDVLAISAFLIFLNLLTPGRAPWQSYSGGFLGLIVGIVHGLLVGVILHFIPSKDVGRQLPNLRVILLLLFNFTCMFLYRNEHLSWLSGSGSLGVLCTSFFASFGWRSVPHWKRSMKKVENSLAHLWTLCVPLLFGTIGNELDFKELGEHKESILKILGIIMCSLVIRCAFMFFLMCLGTWCKCVNFNKKTRFFCALAWIPKATVQAALAPLVKQEFAKSTDKKLMQHSQYVVMMAAFAILITAPLGAILINVVGPCLLTKATDLPDEFPNGEEPGESEFNAIFVTGSNISDEKAGGSLDKMTMALQENNDGSAVEIPEAKVKQETNSLPDDNSKKPPS